jgi:glutaredoxin 3
MARVVIYTTASCPYCLAAKRLLKDKDIAFEEIKVDGDPAGRARMSARAGGRTSVPQIFIGEQHVGGCDDLFDLERRGHLDLMLKASETHP